MLADWIDHEMPHRHRPRHLCGRFDRTGDAGLIDIHQSPGESAMINFTTTALRHLACVTAALLITSVAGASFMQATASVPAQAHTPFTAIA